VLKVKGKGKDIAVRNRNYHTSTGNHMPYELVMAGVVGGDVRDKMSDRLSRSYRRVWRF